jgi:ComF family protein
LIIKEYISSFINLLFPNICIACKNALAGNEQYICTNCMANLPTTNFWLQNNNPIEKIFWGRVPVVAAASFSYFEKDSRLQHILHHLKYKGKSEVGILLGKAFGYKLIDSRFNTIDLIIPVPLHKLRQRQRGYNQSEMIAKGLSIAMKKPMLSNSVSRLIATKSQTNKKRYDRWLNVEGVFNIEHPKTLENKHLLIVDDVITTGATLESLIQEVLKVPGVQVSVVTLATA